VRKYECTLLPQSGASLTGLISRNKSEATYCYLLTDALLLTKRGKDAKDRGKEKLKRLLLLPELDHAMAGTLFLFYF
jgi:hypothetical protein